MVKLCLSSFELYELSKLLFIYTDYKDSELMSLADLDNKMNFIESVAENLGTKEEMDQYVAEKEPESHQFTLSLSPSPCPSPTTSIPPHSEISTSKSSVFPESFNGPSTSMETTDEVKELANQEESNTKEEVVKNKELNYLEKETSAIIQEEQTKPAVELIRAKSESDNVISAEFAAYAVSAVFIPSLEPTWLAPKKSDVAPKESEEIPTLERVELPTSSKAFEDSFDVVYEEEYQAEYGNFIYIACNLNV